MKKLVRLLLVASVLYGTGAHWAILQSAAWAGMLAARAGESSWAEAVSSTFSGEKPCHVCKVVEKGSGAEQGPSVLRPAPAVDLAMTDAPRLHAALPVSIPVVSPLPSVSFLSSRPSVPPPKPVLPV